MLAISFALFFLTLVLYWWKGQKYYKGHKLPPGPIRWPIIGSLPQMRKISEYPYRQFHRLRSTYGDVMSLGMGVNYAVVLSNVEVMKDLLKRPELIDRWPLQFMEQRTNGKPLGLAWSWGEPWVEMRRFAVRKLHEFGFGKRRAIEHTLREEMEHLMLDIRKNSEESGGVWKVDQHRFAVVSINILWNCVAGYRFDPTDELLLRHIEMNMEIFEILRPSNKLLVFPFLKVFPEFSGYNRQADIIKTSWKVMEDFVNDAKVKRQGRFNTEAETFVEDFLDHIEKNRGNPGAVYTEDQLLVVLMDLFFASTDTSSTPMTWMILYFTLNPKVQEYARAEISKMSKNGTKEISLTASSSMPYCQACVLETMRHSPGVGLLPPPRITSSDTFYNDYAIPKGTCVMFSLYSNNHDATFWGDPEVFRPDRFLDASGTALDPVKVDRLQQFGFGKRACPGEGMAKDILFLYVVALLTHFRIEAVVGSEPTLEPGKVGLVIGPQPYVTRFVPIY